MPGGSLVNIIIITAHLHDPFISSPSGSWRINHRPAGVELTAHILPVLQGRQTSVPGQDGGRRRDQQQVTHLMGQGQSQREGPARGKTVRTREAKVELELPIRV